MIHEKVFTIAVSFIWQDNPLLRSGCPSSTEIQREVENLITDKYGHNISDLRTDVLSDEELAKASESLANIRKARVDAINAVIQDGRTTFDGVIDRARNFEKYILNG